jgi:hypothetical protein
MILEIRTYRLLPGTMTEFVWVMREEEECRCSKPQASGWVPAARH